MTQTLPTSLEAEMALLGAMLVAPEVVPEILELGAAPEDFNSESHSAIFHGISTVWDKAGDVDLVLLTDHLRGRGMLDLAGGEAYLVKLAEETPGGANASYYAKIVRSQAKNRRGIVACEEAIFDLKQGGEPDEILDKLETAVLSIRETAATDHGHKIGDVVASRLEQFAKPPGLPGLSTGFPDLDRMTGGLRPGELWIVGARPSVGKTAFAMNLAEQVCRAGKLPGQHVSGYVGVLVFSLEMTAAPIADRLMAAYTGLDAQRISARDIGPDGIKKLAEARVDIDAMPLFVEDPPSASVMQIRAKARRKVHSLGVRAIFIDYLGLIHSPASRHSRETDVAQMSRGIKSLARELNVPIVLLSQLNRQSEHREGNRPRLSDLRESGAIEQDADVVILLHREAYGKSPDWLRDNPDQANHAEVIIAKQRNGPTGSIGMHWDAKSTRFSTLSLATPPQGPRGGAASSLDPHGLDNWP